MKYGKRNMGWVVKADRPEEYLGSPKIYYSDDEVEKYAKSGGMRRAQEKIAYRILELLELKENSSILDVGCGPGYTATIYKENGFNVTGLDLMPKMVEKAKEKGLNVFIGDMRNIKEILNGHKFDAVVSASALQWLKDKEDIKEVAEGISSIIKKNAPVIIQFYPKSEQELKEVANVFFKNGFVGRIIVDNPEIPKNRTVFIVMKKK